MICARCPEESVISSEKLPARLPLPDGNRCRLKTPVLGRRPRCTTRPPDTTATVSQLLSSSKRRTAQGRVKSSEEQKNRLQQPLLIKARLCVAISVVGRLGRGDRTASTLERLSVATRKSKGFQVSDRRLLSTSTSNDARVRLQGNISDTPRPFTGVCLSFLKFSHSPFTHLGPFFQEPAPEPMRSLHPVQTSGVARQDRAKPRTLKEIKKKGVAQKQPRHDVLALSLLTPYFLQHSVSWQDRNQLL